MNELKSSKKGRKPKNKVTPIFIKDIVNTDTPIITHLMIDHSDIMSEKNDDIFIKSDNIDFNKENKILKNKIDELNEKLKKYENKTKPCIHPLINTCSKCWWCRYNYSTPTVELPEHYYNNTFYNIGYFCSYNCAIAFNIDINDENVSKRHSLLHLHYIKTYNEHLCVKPSPSWKILKDYGGSIDIDEYRNNFIINKTNYLYLKPPIISRISYVEKVPINSEIEVIKSNEYILKRSKPLNSTKYSLEATMGLKKILNIVE